ncbi:MAG: insulinase family protein [Bacteroidales bacterium]|nr:insulinase family protein [Candidatus Cacconaster merdequi]
MKRFFNFVLAAVLLLTVAAGCGPRYETVKGDPTGARIYTLDNGLKVYLIVNKDQPRIDAQIAVKVGSKNDPRETTGLAHYFEHLMFKGTEQFGTMNYEQEKPMLDEIEALFEVYRQTEGEEERAAIYHQIDSISYEASKLFIPNEYDKMMSAIGASGTNAYTSYDVTCYVENIPSNQIEAWAKVQSDRFENCVLRGFHTELETIYEEYNMYSAQDRTKFFNAMFEGLFENHPYNTDVIGLPSHLKNPSITNVKNYHDQWYVPNNMAVVMVGDLDPDKTIKIIKQYFGGMKPNENLKKMEFEPEKPITEPIVKTVIGNESPSVLLAWRFPGANSPEMLTLNAFENVLCNGTAGLIDLDVNQQQKTLGMYAGVEDLADYSVFIVMAEPKDGQTLDEVRDIALAEIEKIKAGDFDEDLLEATINNLKRDHMRMTERTSYLARTAVNSFINDVPWSDFVTETDRLSAITKEDIVKFANEHFSNNYVQVNKLQGKDPDDTKIAKPAITPIMTNRDTASQFLTDFQKMAAAVKPIEPVFIDYQKDMSQGTAKSGINVLYKENVTNGLFEFMYIFESGSNADKVLPIAADYTQYIGTSTMTSEEVQKAFYKLACNFSVSCSSERTYVSVNGLAENMKPALELAETIISDAQPNPEALSMLKANTLLERRNAKTDQNSNASRLQRYALYGPHNSFTDAIKESDLLALTDDQLIGKINSLFNVEHEALYYGPLSIDDAIAVINETHKCPETLAPVAKADPYKYQITEDNSVIIAPYDANQLILYSISSNGEPFDPEREAVSRLFNEYFGGNMSSIVFQEMREARGLAYSAGAYYSQPDDLDHSVVFMDYIQTQNDKLIDALDAFNEILNEMPVSEKSFKLAKEGLISNMRTHRTVKSAVLDSYLNARELGLDYDIDKPVFEKIQNFTIDDVVKFQQDNIKGRKYTICILGRAEDFDMESLAGFGQIKKVTTEEIFGY